MGSLKTLIINNTDVVTCNAIKGTYCTKKKKACSQLNIAESIKMEITSLLVDSKSGTDFGKLDL